MQPPSFSDRLLEQLRLAALAEPQPPKAAEELAAESADLARRLQEDIDANNERLAREKK